MKISGKQVTASRNLLGITQVELAAAAGVDAGTILRFETGQSEPQRASLNKIKAELESRGIEFTNGDSPPSGGDGIGVRLNYAKAAAHAQMSIQAASQSAEDK